MYLKILRDRVNKTLALMLNSDNESKKLELPCFYSLEELNETEAQLKIFHQVPETGREVPPYVRLAIFQCCRKYFSSPEVKLLPDNPLSTRVNLKLVGEEIEEKEKCENKMMSLVRELSSLSDVKHVPGTDSWLDPLELVLLAQDEDTIYSFYFRSLLSLIEKQEAGRYITVAEVKKLQTMVEKTAGEVLEVDSLHYCQRINELKGMFTAGLEKLGKKFDSLEQKISIDDTLLTEVLFDDTDRQVLVPKFIRLVFNEKTASLLHSFYPEKPRTSSEGSFLDFEISTEDLSQLEKLHKFLKEKLGAQAVPVGSVNIHSMFGGSEKPCVRQEPESMSINWSSSAEDSSTIEGTDELEEKANAIKTSSLQNRL